MTCQMTVTKGTCALLLGVAVVILANEPAIAVECGCVSVDADSYSDAGECVVIESNPPYCTLNWRHRASSEPTDEREVARADRRTRAFVKFAKSGALPVENMFADSDPWSQIAELAADEQIGKLYKGAATYLEQTPPEKYDKDLALASIAILIGSSTNPQNSSVPTVVLRYLSDFAKQVFGRVTGRSLFNPEPRKTALGLIADFSAYGCFEIQLLPSDGTPDAFDLRIGVRTKYAEDSFCLRHR